MGEMRLPSSGPIVVFVELRGPRTSRWLTMVLNTGAALTVIPIDAALAIGYDPIKATGRVELVTASGVELVPQLTIRAVRSLGHTVRNLAVVCHDLPAQSPVKGLLGLDFLRHFALHLDFPRRQLTLNKTDNDQSAGR